MQLNHLSSTHSRPKRRRVGRGNAGTGGTTAGRGTKGQLARTGHNIPRTFIGGATPLIQRLPKLKGFKSLAQSKAKKPMTVSVKRLVNVLDPKETVTLGALIAAGIISDTEALRGVKIVGGTGNEPAYTFETGNEKLQVSKQLASR